MFGTVKLQFIVLLENDVGNAVLSVPKEFWGSMPQNSYDFHDLQYKYMPLRGRNAEDSVPYGMLEKLQLCCFRGVSTLETGRFHKNASIRGEKVL